MTDPHKRPAHPSRQRRADADRSIARILDATLETLAIKPEATMEEIARQAGVVRATIYVHFPTRDSLLAAVTERAITEASVAIAAAEPDEGDPIEALARVITAAWRALARFHVVVALDHTIHHTEAHKHHAIFAQLHPLVRRGQRDGSFRKDVPSTWHLATLLGLVHTAVGELQAKRISDDEVESALVATVLGALGTPPTLPLRGSARP